MVEYILGNYLVESGRISKEQLDSIAGRLDKVRVKLGLIAVAEGMMTREQADEVNRLQAVKDKRFGDIAVEQGYLTDEQIGNLLKAQGNTYMVFIQSLVDDGLINMDEIDNILEEYRLKNNFSKADIEMLKSDNPEMIIPLFLTPETMKYQDIAGVMVRAVIRCIDRHMYIGKAYLSSDTDIKLAAIQDVEGEFGFTSSLVESEGGLLRLASIFGQEEFDALEGDGLDAACEFLNCINGLHASALSQSGAVLELLPPRMVTDTEKLSGEVCCIPVYAENKKFIFTVKQMNTEDK